MKKTDSTSTLNQGTAPKFGLGINNGTSENARFLVATQDQALHFYEFPSAIKGFCAVYAQNPEVTFRVLTHEGEDYLKRIKVAKVLELIRGYTPDRDEEYRTGLYNQLTRD